MLAVHDRALRQFEALVGGEVLRRSDEVVRVHGIVEGGGGRAPRLGASGLPRAAAR